jgi:hypothetical protein
MAAPSPRWPRSAFQRCRAFLLRAADIWNTKEANKLDRVHFWIAIMWVAAILLRV